MFGPYSGNPWIITDSANHAYWAAQSLQAGTTIEDDDLDTFGFSRVQLVWSRSTPTGTREDVIVASLSFAAAAGGVATPLSSTDKGVVETALGTWWTSAKATTDAQKTLERYRWYDYQPITSRPGPVDRDTAVGSVGTAGTGRVPDQLAISQTFKTASRRHWGRWYLPTTCQNVLEGTYGRITSGGVTALQGYTRTLLQVSGGSGLICPVVASIEHHAVMGIRELQTDNIWDVIRSRRAKQPSQRVTNTS